MLTNCQSDTAKLAPYTKKNNVACNKLESKRPNRVYKNKFQKKRDAMNWKKSEIEVFIFVCSLKPFFWFI